MLAHATRCVNDDNGIGSSYLRKQRPICLHHGSLYFFHGIVRVRQHLINMIRLRHALLEQIVEALHSRSEELHVLLGFVDVRLGLALKSQQIAFRYVVVHRHRVAGIRSDSGLRPHKNGDERT
jgi:hypothetical protein